METITLNSHVGEDGILHLDIPVNIINTDLTITIILKPSDDFQQKNKPKGKGCPANFCEETSGCLKDTPLTSGSECWVLFPLLRNANANNPTYLLKRNNIWIWYNFQRSRRWCIFLIYINIYCCCFFFCTYPCFNTFILINFRRKLSDIK